MKQLIFFNVKSYVNKIDPVLLNSDNAERKIDVDEQL
jgi:hypothetical protein